MQKMNLTPVGQFQGFRACLTANDVTVSWVQHICCQTSHQTERNQPLSVVVIVIFIVVVIVIVIVIVLANQAKLY